MERAFSCGSDIWPWLSKLIDRPSFEVGLFNDYWVVHFHLGVGFGGDGYIKRTGELLFAVVDAVTVHEIGIFYHGEWYERQSSAARGARQLERIVRSFYQQQQKAYLITPTQDGQTPNKNISWSSRTNPSGAASSSFKAQPGSSKAQLHLRQ